MEAEGPPPIQRNPPGLAGLCCEQAGWPAAYGLRAVGRTERQLSSKRSWVPIQLDSINPRMDGLGKRGKTQFDPLLDESALLEPTAVTGAAP